VGQRSATTVVVDGDYGQMTWHFLPVRQHFNLNSTDHKSPTTSRTDTHGRRLSAWTACLLRFGDTDLTRKVLHVYSSADQLPIVSFTSGQIQGSWTPERRA
jgi:hypothetical protein